MAAYAQFAGTSLEASIGGPSSGVAGTYPQGSAQNPCVTWRRLLRGKNRAGCHLYCPSRSQNQHHFSFDASAIHWGSGAHDDRSRCRRRNRPQPWNSTSLVVRNTCALTELSAFQLTPVFSWRSKNGREQPADQAGRWSV